MPRFQKALAQLMRQEGGGQRPPRDEGERTDTVISELRTRVSATELALVSPFSQIFLENARLLESALPAADVAGLTLGACRFLCDRLTLKFALRAYVPTTAEHNWSSPHLVLEIAGDDQPGLVNAVCGIVAELGGEIEALVNVSVHVERDDTGLARSIRRGDGLSDECLLHLQLASVGNPAGLESSVRRHLEALGRTRRDAAPLRRELQQLIALLSAGAATDREAAAFLQWLDDGSMILAGFQQVAPNDGSPARSLGIYLDPPNGIDAAWDGSAIEESVALGKTRAPDPAHPGEFLDEIRIRPASPSECQAYSIAGAFGSSAFTEPTSGIPLARTVATAVLEDLRSNDEAVAPGAAKAVFDSLPIHLVLGSTAADIADLVRSILAADAQPGFRMRITAAPRGSAATCFVTVIAPRQHLARKDADRVSQIVRESIAPILARRFISDDLAIVRLHYTVDIAADKLRPEVLDLLTMQLRKVLSSWRETSVVERSPALAAPLAAPGSKPETTQQANRELLEIQPDATGTRRMVLRLATTREAGVFDALMSAMGDLDLRVTQHRATEGADSTDVHELVVEADGNGTLDAANLAELLRAVRARTVESDILGSLCWRANLSPSSIEVLRAFSALAEHRGVATRTAVHQALARNTEAAAALLRAFQVKFDPRLPVANDLQRKRDFDSARDGLAAAALRSDESAMRRALRELGKLLDLTVRTSFFRGDRNQAGRAIALKLQDRDRPEAPYETFVYAPSFEGILMRGGLAARTTLRSSDDLSTLRSHAALDLADHTLRACYVSVDPGSAVVALKDSSRSAERIDLALRSFLETLLDVTDNVTNGALVRDDAIVAYDEADSYFSLLVGERPTGLADLAREVLRARGFWMAEAAIAPFDQRVAAEGAWSGLLGLFDAQRTAQKPISAVAIGSPHQVHLPPGVRLIAAIDEHEIFLDPSSDAKQCGEALAKLSRHRGASWSDFPVDLRGRGSAVVPRDARKFEISEEARSLLGWTVELADGPSIARAILAIGADLLWTRSTCVHVVTRSELDREASGRLEVETSGIGARVVAEVGYELFSPMARVDFALAGGTLHSSVYDGMAADVAADQVSNVDLALIMAGPARAGIEIHSASVAEEIRSTAMEAPLRRVLSIGLEQRRSLHNWNAVSGCIRRLREEGGTEVLDQHLGSETTLGRRQGVSPGLTRPEIVALCSVVGLRLQSAIRRSSLCQDPYLRAWIDEYFPTQISQQFSMLIDQHPLRHEIAALATTERLLDVMGFAFVADTAESHGRPEIEIIKAWCAVFIFGGAQEVRTEIDRTGIKAGSADHQMHRLALDRALRRATCRMVELRPVDLRLEKMIDRFAAAVGEILRAWPELLPEATRRDHEYAVDLGVRTGLPRNAADHLARIAHLAEIVDICDLAIQINSPRSVVATAFLGLDPLLRFNEIGDMIEAVADQDPQWGTRAAAHLHARLAVTRRGLAAEVVTGAAGRRHPVDRYVEAHGNEIEAVQRLFGEIRSRGHTSIAALEVLIGGLENLIHGYRKSW